MQVKNFHNKNQFVITGNDYISFQSYDSTVAEIQPNGKIKFGKNWDFSATTKKHLYLFLNEYKNNIENFQYSQIFHKNGGINAAKNKRAFLQNLIDKKVIFVTNL